MIKAIAVDDEPPALRIIESFCEDRTDLILVKTFTKPKEALMYTRQFPVDLVFLDIQMPGQTGLELARSLAQPILKVFTTAFSEFAIEGFDIQALDFLLKPFSKDRFDMAVMRATESLNLKRNGGASQEKFILLRVDYSLVKVLTADILFIEGLDDYLKIHIQDQKTLVVRMTMKNMVEKLPDSDFVRVHRSFIIPLARIESVRNKVVSVAGEEIAIGKMFQDSFFQKFKGIHL